MRNFFVVVIFTVYLPSTQQGEVRRGEGGKGMEGGRFTCFAGRVELLAGGHSVVHGLGGGGRCRGGGVLRGGHVLVPREAVQLGDPAQGDARQTHWPPTNGNLTL